MHNEIQELLKRAPGPSPWYLRSFGPRIQTKSGLTSWVSAGEGSIESGKTVLHTEKKKNLAVFGFYNWIWGFENCYLMSYSQQSNDGGIFSTPIILNLYDPNSFVPFESVDLACQQMNERKTSVYQNGGLVASCEIPTGLVSESRNFAFPEPFSHIEELLVLCRSTGISAGDGDVSNLGLMILRPSRSSYEIFPQDWFNQGKYDFGYQWVTRVIRNRLTGQIIGDGIRLPAFALDDSLCKVEQWL